MTDIVLVRSALRRSRVVALLGPRQCGKTTLAREIVAPDSVNYFDLEDPRSIARLSEPDLALRPLKRVVDVYKRQNLPCGSVQAIGRLSWASKKQPSGHFALSLSLSQGLSAGASLLIQTRWRLDLSLIHI